MKSKMKRRMLAIVLCMVIVLSNSSFIFASSESGTPAVEAASTEGTTSQTETDTQGTETTPQTLAVSESTPAPTDESAAPTSVEATPTPTDTPEVTMTPEPTGTPTPEATPTPTDTPQPTDTPETTTTPEPTDTPETTTTPEPTDTPEATPTPTQGPENGTSDTAQPTETPTPTEAPVKSNEAVELKQEFKDSDGNVTSTVKAQIPEGTFAADASEITMEVQTPDTASAEHVKEMMEELLPENHMLGDYIFYDIQFKVNGTVTEPQKPITITFEGNELSVKDVKRANVFWLDPEDPQVDGDKDQLVEIAQKSEMIENLQNSGQSTENIDDYDLSEITLKEDGISDKIQMEGRTSTIYGCYVVYEPVQVLTYDDDQVTVTVSAAEEGIIPANAELKVVPITAEDKNTEDQYKEVEQKLQEKAEEDAYDIAGFLAYDITFVDEDGNETEPGGEVKVSIDYKEAAIPETISEEDAANAEVTVLHLEEDEKGEVKEVVDMAQNEKVDVLATTEENKVEKVEVRTESFSTFTITWEYRNSFPIQIIDDSANRIGENQYISKNKLEDLDTENGMSPKDIAEKYNISGYTFFKAVIGKNIDNKTELDKATEITRLRYSGEEWRYKTPKKSSRWEELDDNKVYFVYQTSSSKEVKVYFVSGEDGTEIKTSMTLEEFFNEYSDEGAIQETKELAPDLKEEGYRFVKTVVDDTYNRYEGTTNDSRYWALRLRKEYNGTYQYNKARIDSANNNQWQIINKPVYFIYKEDTGIITTRNSTDDGITLKLFNYDESINEEAIGAGFPFHNRSTNNVDGTYDNNTGGNVQSTLSSRGYPVSSNKTELDFLFGENAMEANYLFQYDETTRSYEYDSELNHALYDDDEERFYVYDYKLGPARTGGNFGESYSPFNVGNFFPFNDVINPEHGELNFIQSGRENRTNIDYWFGMSMGLTFYQPANGKIANEPMKFEFRGDDDVFVYLDGVLILDLGGIHAAQEGNIDFSTGIVTEVTENTTTKSVYELYKDSRLFTEQELAQKFKKVTINGREYMIFRDDTNIEMNFFYLERGAGASNCHIKFNMPPIPENTIIVGKEIDNANAYVYSDVEFSFKLELKGEDSDSFESVTNTSVKVYDKAGNVIDEARPVDENGIFKLKHGEQAYFPDIPITTQYKVTELDVDSDEYKNIEITGVTINQIKGDGESSTIHDWVTEELLVAETPRVIFHNVIDPQLNTEFRITKQLISDVSSQKTFQIKVYLGDEANKDDGQAYTGEYIIDERPLYADDGIIELEANQTATIMRLPSGTSFKVVEVDPNTGLETEIYADPSYNIEYHPRNGTISQINGKDAAIGRTVVGNTDVTVVNSYNPKIVVEKEWKPSSPSDISEIQVGLYKLDGQEYVPIERFLTLTSPDWSGKFEGLESGTDYTVKELQEVSDPGDAEFTIGGKYYKGVGKGQSVEIGGSNYSVNYETSSNGQITTITITNSIADEWKIVKKSSSKNSDGTNADVPAGAKFTLTDSKNNICYDGEVLEGNQGVISWSRNEVPVENSEIEAGTYVLKEIQAPAGFAISNEEWTLIFAAKGVVPTIMKGESEYKVEPIEENGKKVYTFIFENTPIFDLPSAGSSGIFGYTMGGTLLLMAGTLILYKMKRKEVQES